MFWAFHSNTKVLHVCSLGAIISNLCSMCASLTSMNPATSVKYYSIKTSFTFS